MLKSFKLAENSDFSLKFKQHTANFEKAGTMRLSP